MQTKVCRLCCEHEGVIHIFENTCELKPSTKIMYCCNKSKVNIEEDDALPKLICSTCNIQLNQTYNFILQCESADQKLRSLKIAINDDSNLYQENDQDTNILYEFKVEYKSDREKSNSPLLQSSSVLNGKEKCSITQTTKKKRNKKVILKPGLIHCPTCDKSCSNNSSLIAHMRSHSDKRPFKCSLCDKKYKDPVGLKRHIETNHTEFRTRNFVCENCGKGFFTKKCLKIHTRTHTGETPYACKLCPARFSQSGSLIRHKRTHTGEKPYKCSSCQKDFRSKSELTIHTKVHSQEKKYSCVFCNLKFKHSHSLKKHVQHHENKPTYFVCDLCKRTFFQKNNLALHIKRRHSAQSGYCSLCSKYASNIEMHMWKHNDYRGFKCDYCSSSFFDKKGLVRHMTYKHKDYKHKCLENGCGAIFPVKQMLNYHIAKFHATEKPFPCDLCSRAFYRKSDCVRHKLGTHKENLK